MPKKKTLIAALIALALADTQTSALAADKVHVGKAQGAAWTFLPVDAGVQQGFFAKQGLDVDSADLGGDAKVQQALAAGSIDIGLGSGPGLAFAAKGGASIGVAAFAGPPRNIGAIVLEDSPIKSVAGLKGKMIAVSSVGSLSDWLTKQMAIQEGWGQDGVKTVPLGAIAASVAAMKAHQVDAVVLGVEAGFALEERHEGRILISMDHYAPHFITHVVFAQRAMVAKDPDVISRFLKGFFAGIAYMKSHPAETSALAQKVLHEEASVVDKDAEFLAPMFILDGRFDPEAVAALKRSFVEMDTLPSPPADDAMFTTQFVPVKY